MNYLVFKPPSPPTDIKIKTRYYQIYAGNDIINVYKIDKGTNTIIIFSHGTGTDIGRLEKRMETLFEILGLTIYIYDYIGYGCNARTKPSEELYMFQ